jgi:hypothetical protein
MFAFSAYSSVTPEVLSDVWNILGLSSFYKVDCCDLEVCCSFEDSGLTVEKPNLGDAEGVVAIHSLLKCLWSFVIVSFGYW